MKFNELGTIHRRELRAALQSMGEDVTVDALEQLFNEADVDGNGV